MFPIRTKFAYHNKVYEVVGHIAGPTVQGERTTVHHCVNIYDDNDREQVNGSVVAEGVGLVVAEGLFQRLISGWGTRWSKTKKRPYYVHPDFESTWYCPGLKSTTIHGYTRGEWDANKWSAKKTWTTSGDGSNLNTSDINRVLPAKLKAPVDTIIENVLKKRIILHINEVSSEQKADMNEAVKILLRGFKEVYKDMPDNIADILINELLDADGNYILKKDSGFKCGDSGKLPRRINEQVDGVKVTNSNFNEHGFCFQLPSQYLISGMVNQSIIDDLLALCNLPMLGGLHPDCYPIFVKKILRQVVEFYAHGSYDFVRGPVLEWILRAPSEIERKVNDLVEISTAIQSQEDILQKIINMKLGIVNDKDTWRTIQTQLSLESSLEYFQDPHYDYLSGHMAKSNVDKEYYGEFTDLISEPPYSTMVMPMIDKLNNVLDRDDVSKEDTQPILESMETNVYQEPDDEEHCLTGYEFIIKLDEKHTDEITRMRSATIDLLRSGEYGVTEDEFEQLFGTTIEFTGLKFVNTAEGIVVEVDVVLRIHLTKKNSNIIIERGSHFRALAPNTRTVDRLNALYSYNYESVFMNKIGKLSDESLNNIQRSNLTRTMLIMGIDKQGSNENNFWHALMYTLPNGVSDPGSKIGQGHLQPVITISSEMTDDDLSDTLPIDLIYLMIWKVPEFNKLLKLHGGKIRIDSTEQGRHYLLVPNETGDGYLTYYKHHDKLHSDNSVTKAIGYINKVRGRPEPLLLDAVSTTLHKLYDSIDQYDFKKSERKDFYNLRAVQFLDKIEDGQDLLSEAFDLFLSRAGYALLKTFLQHVEHMDELSEDDENKFVDENGKGWLVLLGSNDTPPGRTRDYMLNFMRKTGREYELMRKHLVMKGYPHMANRRMYDEVMRVRNESSTESGARVAAANTYRQGVGEANSGFDHALSDYLDSMYVNEEND